MILDEFLYKIGFDIDTNKIKQTELILKNISNTAKSVSKPIASGVDTAILKNKKLIDHLNNSVQKAKEWGNLTKQKIDNVASSFDNVSKSGQSATKNIKQTTNQINKVGEKKPVKGLRQELDELKNKFFLIGVATTAVSGLIANYLQMPLQNIKEFAKEKNKLFDITQNEINQANDYQEKLKATKTSIQSITTQIALKLIPTVNQNLVGFNNFLRANKALVVDGLTNVFKWIIKLGQVFTNTFRGLNYLIANTIGWKNTLLILAGVLIFVKRAIISAFVTSPIGIVIAILSVLMFLIDDLMVYLDGGESLLGDFWKSFIKYGKIALNWFNSLKPTIEQILNNIKGIFVSVFNVIVGAFKLLVGIFTADFDLIEQGWNELWSGAINLFNALIDTIKIAFNVFIEIIKNLFSVIWQFISTGFENLGKVIVKPFEIAFKWIKEQYDTYIKPIVEVIKNFSFDNIVDSAKQKIKNLGTLISDGASDLLNQGLNFLGFDNNAPKAALATQNTNNTKNISYQAGNSTTTINVNTNNPQMATQIINNRQKNDLSYTHFNLNGGF